MLRRCLGGSEKIAPQGEGEAVAAAVPDAGGSTEKNKEDPALQENVSTAPDAGGSTEKTKELSTLSEERVLPTVTDVGTKKDSNKDNLDAFKSGTLKHEPPAFDFFEPVENEGLPVVIKEIKLPKADQTHEVCFEPVTACVFVSQMSNCTLVRIPLGPDGLLADVQDAWKIGVRNEKGDGISGIHNISLSYKNPGCLWMSLQYPNQLLLVDARPEHTMRVRSILEVPTLFTDPGSGKTVRVGGPHCMRECPVTGEIWVGLKGALKDAPCGERKNRKDGGSSCCDPEKLKENMTELAKLGRDTPLPDGWAVWRVALNEYNPTAEGGAKGGSLHPCLKSPPMLTFDKRGNVYVPQDGADILLYVDRATGAAEQLKVPFPASGATPRITGPSAATGPDGAVWISLLGSYNALVRFDPDKENKRTLYEFGGPPWCKKLRLIHIAFSAASDGDDYNRIYALASDLLDDEAVNAVVVLRMDDKWRTCLGRRIVPLPTQDCACHRIEFIDATIAGRGRRSRSIAITELASSKLLQIKVRNLLDMEQVQETISIDADGFEVRSYTSGDDEACCSC
eukprot:TRINITY_DN19223_c0_g1_i2.p1 TRINITY_DN19223_c0_g1~~TRINITY_DN19223_c0_g1_i2.p1  ORF type:complete len:567 (+),score=72.85 TRINITY_DN19223_c0_g1_i2:46-1746(+)